MQEVIHVRSCDYVCSSPGLTSVAQMKKSLYSHPKAKDRLIPKALTGTHCQPDLIVTEGF